MKETMPVSLAVFNGHINDAFSKAKKAFIKRFSQEDWNTAIEPFCKKGIMGIFRNPPNEKTSWYVESVAMYVNEVR